MADDLLDEIGLDSASGHGRELNDQRTIRCPVHPHPPITRVGTTSQFDSDPSGGQIEQHIDELHFNCDPPPSTSVLCPLEPVLRPQKSVLCPPDKPCYGGGGLTLSILGEPQIIPEGGTAIDLTKGVASVAQAKSRRVTELIVYLAAHGGVAGRGSWLTDVSPNRSLEKGYVRNIVCLARQALEAMTGVADLLIYERSTQRLVLDEGIQVDWDVFMSLAEGGTPTHLRNALSLVRGAPFGVNPAPWTSATGVSYALADRVVQAAVNLGRQALVAGDSGLANWSARKGQLVNRYDQSLWRIRLRAAGHRGDRFQIWSELQDQLRVDGDPEAGLEPATLAAYQSQKYNLCLAEALPVRAH